MERDQRSEISGSEHSTIRLRDGIAQVATCIYKLQEKWCNIRMRENNRNYLSL